MWEPGNGGAITRIVLTSETNVTVPRSSTTVVEFAVVIRICFTVVTSTPTNPEFTPPSTAAATGVVAVSGTFGAVTHTSYAIPLETALNTLKPICPLGGTNTLLNSVTNCVAPVTSVKAMIV